MTEKLHPGLGSGALREALANLIKMHDERHLVSVAEANLRVDKAREVLSLSSPIEPDCEFVNGRCKYCDSSKAEVEATTGKCVVIERPQASSEIRELLAEGVRLLWGFRAKDYPATCEWRDRAKEALAPSRQGAGGK